MPLQEPTVIALEPAAAVLLIAVAIASAVARPAQDPVWTLVEPETEHAPSLPVPPTVCVLVVSTLPLVVPEEFWK